MKRIIVLFAIIFSQIIFAQTAKEIIDRNIESSGGLTNWKLLNTVQIQGRVTLGVNDSYMMKIYQQRPNLTKTAIILAGKETPVEGFDGKNGYAMNYAQNKLQQYNDYVPENFDNDFIDYESKGFEADLLGKEKIGEQYYFKVELTKNVNKTIYYFDVKNYSLFREIKKDETLTYSDYRKVGQLLMPYRIESSSPKKDSDYVMMINKIEINKELPKNTFKF
ncbi:histidine kinase [Epilithonimonas sp.]|uniref:histidine kinase n=1 Tax=Epilithonimonas sp. TaxID=2894511 RepID=UPI00289998BB|nr:histidine kinase [Epilithonimonas sp.]